MNKHLRIFLCSVISVLMIFALAIAGCTTTTTTSTSSDSSTTVSDSTGTESTGSDSTGSGDSTTGDSSGSGDSSETHVHDYDYANYELVLSDDMSEATVIVPCTGCDESLTVTASITSEVKTAATNLAKGVTTYTASFTLDGVDYTIPVDVDTPALATVYDAYYINNVESSLADIELFDGFATATGGYWYNNANVTMDDCAIADGYVFQGRLYLSNGKSLTFTLEEDATVTIYALLSYNGNTVIVDEAETEVYSFVSTTTDYNDVKALEMDLDAGTYTISNEKGNTTIYAFMLQDSGKTSVYTEGLWQPAAEEEPDEPVTPDEPIDEDVSSVPETLTLGDNEVTISSTDSNGDGVSSTFTAEEDGTYTFAISADEDGYVMINNSYRLSASGTTSCNIELSAEQSVTVTFWTDDYATATYTLNISSAAVASGTFELETETDYTFTAPIAGTYTFTLSDGDTSTAVIYAGKASYDAYGSALLDVQEDGTSFTYDLAEGETLTLYLAGSDGVTVSYTTGSATSGGDEGGSGTEVTETVIPTLAAGDNAISVTASDAANETASGYYTNYGVSATYTAPENGYYTFSIGASDEYAYVTVIYDTYRYVLSSTSTTTAEMYADGIYIEGGATVTIYFSTLDATGNTVSASYTLTINYVAGTSSLVYPTELTIGGTTEVVMDNSKQLDVSATTVESGTYTIKISYYDDLSEVSVTYIIDNTYYYPTASNDYTITVDLAAGKEINVFAYISSDSDAKAAFGINITYVAKEVETYELTLNAYVYGATSLTPVNDSATDVAIAAGESIYLKTYTGNMSTDYNFVLTISSLDNLTILASTEVDSSDTEKAADGTYTIEVNASAFTQNTDGTYSHSWTLSRRSYTFFMVTASADVTIDVSITYGGDGGTLGGGSTSGEDTNTYIELEANVTTDITWGGEEYAYVVYYTYTAAGATTATLTLNGSHSFFSSSSMVSYLDITVTLNGETVTGTSKILYTLNLIAGENKIVISFAAGSSMITGCTALLEVEEVVVDPTEGYTVLTANKTTEFTWDGESTAYTASFYYYATEAVEATLTISSDQSMFSNTSMISYISMTATLNGDALTGTTPISYTFTLAAGYNYIVISFAGANTMVDGYTYTVKLACEDASHVHTYTDATWVWSDDYSSATLTLACTGCDETISYKVDSTSQVTQEATCTTYGEKVYTVTYTYDDETYTDTKTVSTNYAHSLTHYDAVAATLTTDGNIEYWYCSVCEKYFSDAEGETEITAADIVVKYDTSSTLYNMSATGLTTASTDYLYPVGSSYEENGYASSIFDGTFTVVTTASSVSSLTRLTYKSVTDSVQDNTVTGYTDDNGTTLDTTAAINYFTYQKALSFTLTQSATITIWYGLVNSSNPLYISTDMSSSTNIKNSAVATFEINANVTSYASTYYKCVSQGSVTLAAGTYYITTTATSSGNGPYVYAIAIDYDLSGVTISGDTEVTAGNSITLTAAATLADGSASSEAIVWTTSDSSIATVENGVVTGVTAGTVTITATAGDVSATYTVTVTAPVYVSEVTISGDTTVTVGNTLNLTYSVTMSDNSTYTGTVTWATSDSSIATVENGVVTAIAAGEVTITATADGVEGTITITVEKAPAAAMVAGTEYSVDLTTTDTYVETSITITEAGYYTVTVSDNGIISVYDDDGNYYYNSKNCTLGYIIDNTASDEVAIKVAAGTILTVYISLLDYDTAATVTATIAIDANYDEGGSGDSGDYDYTLTSEGLTASLEAGANAYSPATYTIYVSEAGTYTFTVDANGDITVEVNGGDATSVYDGGSENFTVSAGDVITVSSYAATALTVVVYTESGSDTPATTTTIYNVSDVATAAETFTSDTTVFSDDILTLTVITGSYNGYTSIANTNTDLVVPEGVDVTGYAIHLYNVDSGATLTLKTDATLTFYYCTGSTDAVFYIVDSSNNTVYTITPETAAGYGLTATVTLDAGTYTLKADTTGRGAYINIWSIVAEYTATSSGDEGGSTEATTVEYSYNFSNIFTSDDVSSLSGSFTGSSDTETTYYFTESSYTTTAAEGTDYVLTYTTAKTNDKIASTSITDEDGTTYSYAVQPNGSTTGSNLRYFTIDLSEYAGTGKTVTIEIIGTSKTGAQIVLASGATDTSTTNAYAYNTAAESDYATVDVVSYTGTVSSTGLYYITFASQSSRIYAINITVSDATAAE